MIHVAQFVLFSFSGNYHHAWFRSLSIVNDAEAAADSGKLQSVLLLLFWRHKASKCKQIIIMGGAKIHLKPQHPYLFWDLRRIYSINDILYAHILCTLFSRRSSTSRQPQTSRSLKWAIWQDGKKRAFINPF